MLFRLVGLIALKLWGAQGEERTNFGYPTSCTAGVSYGGGCLAPPRVAGLVLLCRLHPPGGLFRE